MCHTILVNPQFVLVGSQPGGVGLDGLAIDEEGWGSGLVPHLQVEFVFASRHLKSFGLPELEFAIECQIELSLASDSDGLSLLK